jgi:hypothetical protein
MTSAGRLLKRLPTLETNCLSVFSVCIDCPEAVVPVCAADEKVAGSIPDETIEFFYLPNPSNRTMALGLSPPVTEMGTRNILGDKAWPVGKADILTIMREPTV